MNELDRTIRPQIHNMDYLTLDTLSKSLKEAIEKYVITEVNVLDIGCGDKPYSSFFKDKAKKYIGIESLHGQYVDCIASAENLPFSSETFEVVISTQVFEHLRDSIKEAHRVLKKGGHIFLSTSGIWEKHGNNYWRWTDDGLKILLNGFKNVEVIPNGGSILCLFQLLNLYINKLSEKLILTKLVLLLVNNLIGKHFDNPNNISFVINYLVVAER